ncbi:hypothetical protein CRUP_019836 [Coryphaenoides rupestris]|nr:hypothetical protein CRUP_019836 [Coryphaenoides rupestris]
MWRNQNRSQSNNNNNKNNNNVLLASFLPNISEQQNLSRHWRRQKRLGAPSRGSVTAVMAQLHTGHNSLGTALFEAASVRLDVEEVEVVVERTLLLLVVVGCAMMEVVVEEEAEARRQLEVQKSSTTPWLFLASNESDSGASLHRFLWPVATFSTTGWQVNASPQQAQVPGLSLWAVQKARKQTWLQVRPTAKVAAFCFFWGAGRSLGLQAARQAVLQKSCTEEPPSTGVKMRSWSHGTGLEEEEEEEEEEKEQWWQILTAASWGLAERQVGEQKMSREPFLWYAVWLLMRKRSQKEHIMLRVVEVAEEEEEEEGGGPRVGNGRLGFGMRRVELDLPSTENTELIISSWQRRQNRSSFTLTGLGEGGFPEGAGLGGPVVAWSLRCKKKEKIAGGEGVVFPLIVVTLTNWMQLSSNGTVSSSIPVEDNTQIWLFRAVMLNCLQHILQVLLAPGCCHKV